jgi:hypothetical protein
MRTAKKERWKDETADRQEGGPGLRQSKADDLRDAVAGGALA